MKDLILESLGELIPKAIIIIMALLALLFLGKYLANLSHSFQLIPVISGMGIMFIFAVAMSLFSVLYKGQGLGPEESGQFMAVFGSWFLAAFFGTIFGAFLLAILSVINVVFYFKEFSHFAPVLYSIFSGIIIGWLVNHAFAPISGYFAHRIINQKTQIHQSYRLS